MQEIFSNIYTKQLSGGLCTLFTIMLTIFLKCSSCLMPFDHQSDGKISKFEEPYCSKCKPFLDYVPINCYHSNATCLNGCDEIFSSTRLGTIIYYCDNSGDHVLIYPDFIDIPLQVSLKPISLLSFDIGSFGYNSLGTISLILQQPGLIWKDNCNLYDDSCSLSVGDYIQIKNHLGNVITRHVTALQDGTQELLLPPLIKIIASYKLGYLTDFYQYICNFDFNLNRF